jgi:hypothetical protein
MKQTIAHCLVKATNWSLTRLRNGNDHYLTRDEIRFARLCFSQFGEDLAVLRWVERLNGIVPVYVDAGCFHPIHFSNTLLLHKLGWRGVNIDLNDEKIALFRRLRPIDFNVVAALSRTEQEVACFEYGLGVTDRLGPLTESKFKSVLGETPLRSAPMRTQTLNRVLEEAPWKIERIGYLNVDCEGHDLEVIQGIELGRYEPTIITIEATCPEEIASIGSYLSDRGYEHEETLGWTLLFVRRSSL